MDKIIKQEKNSIINPIIKYCQSHINSVFTIFFQIVHVLVKSQCFYPTMTESIDLDQLYRSLPTATYSHGTTCVCQHLLDPIVITLEYIQI